MKDDKSHNFQRILFSLMFILNILSRCCHAHNSYAMTYELEDNDKMCFYEHFEEGKKYILEFEVVKGGKRDVDVSLESPNGKIIYKEKKRRKDKVNFDTSFGSWKFCFSNEFSTVSHKTIYFELRPYDHDTLKDEAGIKKPSVNTQVEESLEAIHRAGTRVVSLQTEYRLKEAKGRYGAESLNTTVQWWSIVMAIIILLTGSGQVFILRNFFTDTQGSKNFPRASENMKQITP